MKLHLAAMDRNRRASCESKLALLVVIQTRSSDHVAALALLHTHLLQDQFNVSRVGLDIHTMLLSLNDPAQHHDRLVVRGFGPQDCSDLGLCTCRRWHS